MMSPYVHPTEPLVTEIVVRDIRRPVDFYEGLGFALLRDGGDFVELTWEDHRLYLADVTAFHLDSGRELPASGISTGQRPGDGARRGPVLAAGERPQGTHHHRDQ